MCKGLRSGEADDVDDDQLKHLLESALASRWVLWTRRSMENEFTASRDAPRTQSLPLEPEDQFRRLVMECVESRLRE